MRNSIVQAARPLPQSCTPFNVECVVRARIASSHSSCELGVKQPLASQSAPLEKVVHVTGAEGGSGGSCGGAGGCGGGDGKMPVHGQNRGKMPFRTRMSPVHAKESESSG